MENRDLYLILQKIEMAMKKLLLSTLLMLGFALTASAQLPAVTLKEHVECPSVVIYERLHFVYVLRLVDGHGEHLHARLLLPFLQFSFLTLKGFLLRPEGLHLFRRGLRPQQGGGGVSGDHIKSRERQKGDDEHGDKQRQNFPRRVSHDCHLPSGSAASKRPLFIAYFV